MVDWSHPGKRMTGNNSAIVLMYYLHLENLGRHLRLIRAECHLCCGCGKLLGTQRQVAWLHVGLGGLDNNRFRRRRRCLAVLAAMSEASEFERKVERLNKEIEREAYDRLPRKVDIVAVNRSSSTSEKKAS